jgi:CDGSH-type Zn-finger protein/uncharacterized membrane protein YozB (DUF420 family)
VAAPTPSDGSTIEVTKDGPYLVTGSRLRDPGGAEIPAPGRFALCRCGNSSKKPFCDGTHAKVGFHGARLATGTADPPDDYRGKRITIHDDRSICAHSGVCTDDLPAVFRLGKEPWIDADGAAAEDVVALVKRCPSGALSYSIDGVRQSAEARDRVITTSKNGPYFVSGGVVLRADGATPRFTDRYALCRCGASKNKPFCDGTHWAVEFDGGRGRQKGVFVPPLGVRRFGLVFGGLLIAGTAVALLALEAAGKRESPGFLGPGGLMADLNLVLEFLLVAGLTFGWWLARRGNIAAHRYNQTVWVLLNTVLVALIMARSMGNAAVSSPAGFAKTHVWVPWLHAAVGAATAVSGLWLVSQMNGWLPRRLHVRGWKTMMRLTLAGYWIVALLGLGIYYVWYV